MVARCRSRCSGESFFLPALADAATCSFATAAAAATTSRRSSSHRFGGRTRRTPRGRRRSPGRPRTGWRGWLKPAAAPAAFLAATLSLVPAAVGVAVVIVHLRFCAAPTALSLPDAPQRRLLLGAQHVLDADDQNQMPRLDLRLEFHHPLRRGDGGRLVDRGRRQQPSELAADLGHLELQRHQVGLGLLHLDDQGVLLLAGQAQLALVPHDQLGGEEQPRDAVAGVRAARARLGNRGRGQRGEGDQG